MSALVNSPISELLEISKEACDLLAPMVKNFYWAINDTTATLKADKSYFTIADGIVQHMIINVLFNNDNIQLKGIIGEENANVNITNRPYTVDSLQVPEEYFDLVDNVVNQIQNLSKKINTNYNNVYKNNTIFVDPIDGTREFSTNLGEQCTILIGISDLHGKAIGGLIYRPIPTTCEFALGCLSENYKKCYFNNNNNDSNSNIAPTLVTTNGSITKFTEELIKTKHYDVEMSRFKSGGAGNKSLLLIENKATCYIQDRGVSRWDTCGPEAVLNAFGGCLVKLTSIIYDNDGSSSDSDSYKYLETTSNLDFIPKMAALTKYNASNVDAVGKDRKLVDDVKQFKEYSNLCGLFALKDVKLKEEYSRQVVEANKICQAEFD